MSTKTSSQENKTLRVIINPISGTRSKKGIDKVINEILSRAGFEVDICYTTCKGDATRLASEAIERGYYGVVACGGDGTVNETATALCGSNVTLGIIPMGSGNGLARHIDIPVHLRESLRVIAKDHSVACDYGTANGKAFFCTFGVGFDAAVSERFARAPKRGLATYIKSTIDEFAGYEPEEYTIIANGQVITERAFLIAACNASQYGNNAFIAPHASITDGVLDITIIHKGNPITRAFSGFEVLAGTLGQNAMSDIIRTAELTIIRNNRGAAHLDGDPAKMPERIEILCHPAQLRIFTPRKKMRFIPIISPMWLSTKDLYFKTLNFLHI